MPKRGARAGTLKHPLIEAQFCSGAESGIPGGRTPQLFAQRARSEIPGIPQKVQAQQRCRVRGRRSREAFPGRANPATRRRRLSSGPPGSPEQSAPGHSATKAGSEIPASSEIPEGANPATFRRRARSGILETVEQSKPLNAQLGRRDPRRVPRSPARARGWEPRPSVPRTPRAPPPPSRTQAPRNSPRSERL